jgi:hypothetical protein
MTTYTVKVDEFASKHWRDEVKRLNESQSRDSVSSNTSSYDGQIGEIDGVKYKLVKI